MNDGISITLWHHWGPSLNQELHCFQALCKVTIANCFKRLFSTNPQSFCYQARLSGLNCILHFCVVWVHSCSFHSPWEFPAVTKTSWWLEKSKFGVTIAHGGLCSGDNRTVANLSIISCSSEYSSLKAHTAKFFVVKDHLSDSVLFLDQALTTDKV